MIPVTVRALALLTLAVIGVMVFTSCLGGADQGAPEAPHLRHLAEKQVALDRANAHRETLSIPAMTLGTNVAAQLHAESGLANCFAGHWDTDGLSTSMKYSLLGGYQSHEAGLNGASYCRRETDGFQPVNDLAAEIQGVVDDWIAAFPQQNPVMNPDHHRMNIGVAYDEYNLQVYVIFESDYVEYEEPPKIENGVLYLSGTTKRHVQFGALDALGVDLYYDPPPHQLTAGQLARGACFFAGRTIAFLLPPTNVGYYQSDDPLTHTYDTCKPPREMRAEVPVPKSVDQASRFYSAARELWRPFADTVPQIRATEWTASGKQFAVRADIGDLLEEHGAGVYTVVVWNYLPDSDLLVSQYSIFHDIAPPTIR